MNQQPEQFCYSLNGESYGYLFDSREEALEEAIAECEGGDEAVIYTAKAKPCTADFFARDQGECLIERMQESAYEGVGEEHFNRWLDDVTKEQSADLAKRIRQAVREWADEHCLHPTFYGVCEVQEHLVPEAAEEGGAA